MEHEKPLIRERLKSPRAAAVAGILFSVLFIASLVLIRLAVPENPQESGAWLNAGWMQVNLGLNLLPFAGVAFLWFIGVIRDRLGVYEDKFFATIFLGSGLLFLAMQFAAAAVAGGIISIFGATPSLLLESGVYSFGRAITYELVNVYAMRMAGVFMISASILSQRTGILPRWMTIIGFVLALFLLFSLGLVPWASFVFPIWVLMISIYILQTNLRQTNRQHLDQPASE